MRLMNYLLRSLIRRCVVVYIDDILDVLQLFKNESLYVNLEKCTFCTSEVIFLGFMVGSHGVRVDKEKVKLIQSWPTPTNMSDVRSFHMLACYYRCFVKDFSNLVAPLNKIIKKDFGFKLSNTLILALPNFQKPFKLECDVSNVSIGIVLLQEGHLIALFSEKLQGIQLNYFTYDKEPYTLVRTLQVFQHYVLSNKFVVHSNHKSLKHLGSQHKLNKRHAMWVKFLEQFPYVIKHKQEKTNIVKARIACHARNKLLGFESLKNLFMEDDDFKEAYEHCANSVNGGFFRNEKFLFKGEKKRLCVARSSIRELLVREAREVGLMSHFSERKTYKTLH
ncbi:Retrovirus-related Pol polyprotein from transposon 17.6, partial [Mucuna pruriens]